MKSTTKIVHIPTDTRDDNIFLLTQEGHVYATGDNSFGQLGLGHHDDLNSFTRVAPCLSKITQIVSKYECTFLLTEEGDLYATGFNSSGQLGLGHNDDLNSFTRVTPCLSKITQIVSGVGCTFLLTEEGHVYATGDNSSGQLGLGHHKDLNSFTRVITCQSKITQIVSNYGCTFLLTEEGHVYATGDNSSGQLGLGHHYNCNSFTQVTTCPSKITQIVSNHICTFLLTQEGHVYVAGGNFSPKCLVMNIENTPYFSRIPLNTKTSETWRESVNAIFTPPNLEAPQYHHSGVGKIDVHQLMAEKPPFLSMESSKPLKNKILISAMLLSQDIRICVYFDTLKKAGYNIYLLPFKGAIIQVHDLKTLQRYVQEPTKPTWHTEYQADYLSTWGNTDHTLHQKYLASIKPLLVHQGINPDDYHILGTPELGELFHITALRADSIAKLNDDTVIFCDEAAAISAENNPALRAVYCQSFTAAQKPEHILYWSTKEAREKLSPITTSTPTHRPNGAENCSELLTSAYKDVFSQRWDPNKTQILLSGNVKVTLKNANGNYILPHKYRLEVFDEIVIENNEVVFKRNDKNIFTVYDPPQTINFLSLPEGVMEGNIQSNESIPIPTTSFNEQLRITMLLKVGLEIHHCPGTGEYRLVNRTSQAITFYLQYWLFMDKSCIQPPIPLTLPKALECKVINVIVEKKLNEDTLETYCSAFSKKNTQPTGSGIDYFMGLIQHQHGACEERANVFFALATFFTIPTRIVRNRRHQWVEILNNNIWHTLDLGGSPVEYLFATNALPTAVQTVTLPTPSLLAPSMPITATMEIPKATPLPTPETPPSLFDIKNPLIVLDYKTSPEGASAYIKQHKMVEKNYVYIHKPGDFVTYYETKTIEDKKIKNVHGLLKIIVDEGGIIVVNWDNFSPAHMGSYMSLLDTTAPSFNGLSLNEKVKMIGLISKAKHPSNAFLSRCTVVNLDIPSLPSLPKKPNSTLEINLFALPNWRDRLFGEINFQDSGITVMDTTLSEIIKAQKGSLCLLNPPHDPDLDEFIYRYNYHRTFLFLGKSTQVPDDSYIYVEEKALDLQLDSIRFMKTDSHISSKRIFYLNKTTYWNFFKRQRLNAQGLPEILPGWLDDYREANTLIDINGPITNPYWQYLVHEINQRKLPVLFRISSGSIEKENMPSVFKSSLNIIKTNDLDYYCKEYFKDNNDLTIPVHPCMTYTELFEVMRLHTRPTLDGMMPSIQYELSDLLWQMFKGKHIILKGDVSPLLFQYLRPLLAPSKGIKNHLLADGNATPICGTLHLILPATTKLPLDTIGHETKLYKADEYGDTPLDKAIITLFELFQKLPSGIDQPEQSPQLTFGLLEKIRNTCLHNHDEHRDNPLKPFFLYSYPKDSEVYAFMNVACKYYLAGYIKGKAACFNQNKYIEIKNKYKLEEEEIAYQHQWKIINCFSGRGLEVFRHQNWLKILEVIQRLSPSKPLPLLSKEDFSLFWKYVEANTFSTQRATPLEKYLNTIQRFIDSNNDYFLMLKGPFGVGKTHTIRQVVGQQHIIFEGLNNVLSWLNFVSIGESKLILLLDEANTAPNGTYHFLTSLEQGYVYYQGRHYKATDHHKVIMTGNPMRVEHDMFQQGMKTLWMKSPQNDLVTKMIQTYAPSLSKLELQQCVDIYFMVDALREYRHLSLRDAKFFASRIKHIRSETPGYSLYDLAIQEFYYSFPQGETRKTFKENLKHLLKNTSPEVSSAAIHLGTDNIIIPSAHHLLYQTLKETIAWMKQDKSSTRRRGILLEGESGVGKSSIFKALLQSCGKKYTHIYGGTPNTVKQLREAFQQGDWVLLDEINLEGPHIEVIQLLLQFLEGVDENGRPPLNEGFTACIAINPVSYEGRISLPFPLLNRLLMIYMPEYDKNDLIEIAMHMGFENSISFVESQLSKNEPINLREWAKWKNHSTSSTNPQSS
jgi:alpha-tubulin suppressor-like RCC1 family protein/MoxR-like ATPase